MRILLNLFMFVIPSLCQEETELQCSAKPGCHIAQCDQAPLDWTKPGFNLDEHLQRNKFPITCVNKNAGKSQHNSGNLLPLITGNIQDIRNVESNLKNIEEKVENNEGNIKGMAELDAKVIEQLTGMILMQDEITELREINKNQSLEIERQSKVVKEQSKKINEMREENKEQFSKLKQKIEKAEEMDKEINDMRKQMSKQSREFDEMRKKNNEQSSQINQQIKEMKKLMSWYKAINGNYYKLFNSRANYARAKANCMKYGARLAAKGIRDDDVRRELLPYLQRGGVHTWIGLNDIEEEGTFYWEDGVRADAGSIPWADDQPSNSNRNQDCVEMVPTWNWKFNDEYCTYSRKYLCEIAM